MESRPVRWQSAVRQANDALYELHQLREQLIAVRDEVEENWTKQQTRLDHALHELTALKSEYASISVPDNLSGSRTQDKLFHVAEFDFEKLRNKVPGIDALFKPLDEFNPMEDDDFSELYLAENADLPKFYGRD